MAGQLFHLASSIGAVFCDKTGSAMSHRHAFLLLISLFVIIVADRYDIPFPDESIITTEGDILTWKRTNTPGMVSSALRDGNRKWPNAQVPYRIHNSISNSEKNLIIKSMEEIHTKTCLRFVPVKEENIDFLLIMKPFNRGCNSFVGKISGRQPLNLGDGCYSQGTILHELMHAIGFIHEHNRADRDLYISVIWSNVEEEAKHNFKKRDASSLTLMGTGYSYDSIMHYSGTAFSKDDKSPTLVPKKTVSKLGRGNTMSPIDVLRINKYYGCSAPTEAPKQEIKWNRYDYDMQWSYGCDFPGRDIESFTSSSSMECMTKCFYNPRCTHMTWTPNRHCNLKSIATAEAVPKCGPSGYVCGVKGSAKMKEPVYSGCTTSEASKQKINWRWVDFDMQWEYGCDFPGHDIETTTSSSGDCLDKCFYNARCTHFTWTPNGACNLKSIAKSDAVPKCGPSGYVCGVKGSAKLKESVYSGCLTTAKAAKQALKWKRYDYDMHWSYGCDFPGRDIESFTSSSMECITKCFYNPRCTHITWTPNRYCNLKSISTSDAVPKCGPSGYMCAVKETAKLQSVTCP